MENIPLALLGGSNFPDIELNRVELSKNEVHFYGHVTLYDVLDSLMIEGNGVLVASTDEPDGISAWIETDLNWLPSTSLPNMTELYLLTYVESLEELLLEGRTESAQKVRLLVPNARLFWSEEDS